MPAAHAPRSAAEWRAHGLALREQQDMPEAADALGRSLALAPDDLPTRFAHAQSCLDAGLPAAALFREAIRRAPPHPGPLRAFVAALLAESLPDEAEAVLVETLRREPAWVDGYRQLAALRWVRGDRAHYADALREACHAHPGLPALWLAWFAVVAQARDWSAADAVLAAAGKALGDLPALRLAELFLAVETGAAERADALFAATEGQRDDVRDLAFLRHSLRHGRLDAAEALALRHTATPLARAVWPYLSLIWRLRGDARADWLDGQPPFIRPIDLPFSAGELDGLAAVLRRLHTARAPYVEQSVRGGTQTDGHLLLRHEPELQGLRRKVLAGVRDYVDALPPPLDGHPLLGTPRSRLRLAGSWSVRLARQGHNVAHTHPKGWISSALYVSLPTAPQMGAPPAGWIQFGSPPPELGLALEPYRQIEPRPGRLALFPSTIWHNTVPFEDGERLVIAFDVQVPDR
ncbi:MAG: hypothetical protein RL026_809 [Pseudomonadota bacterium]|jgi:hypothetical protein